MTKDDISARVRAVISDHLRNTPRLTHQEPAEVSDTARLVCDLAFDSLDTIDVAMALEEAFDVELDDDHVRGSVTIADLATYVAEKLGALEPVAA